MSGARRARFRRCLPWAAVDREELDKAIDLFRGVTCGFPSYVSGFEPILRFHRSMLEQNR